MDLLDVLRRRVSLARLPTPLVRLDRLSRSAGHRILFKRDDLLHPRAWGSSIRGLEYLLHEARARGAERVVTCGDEGSAHVEAAAVLSREAGISPVLFLNDGVPPSSRADGSRAVAGEPEVHFVPREDWGRSHDRIEAFRLVGNNPDSVFVIPQGASNARGALGHVRAVFEMDEQVPLETLDGVFIAAETGGAYAGLQAGLAHLQVMLPVIGINSTVTPARVVALRVQRILREVSEEFGVAIRPDRDEIDIADEYRPSTDGVPSPHEREWRDRLEQEEGIRLDGPCAVRAFAGMMDLARIRGYRKILFVHTGPPAVIRAHPPAIPPTGLHAASPGV